MGVLIPRRCEHFLDRLKVSAWLPLILDDEIGRELQQPVQVGFQFLEVHETIEAVADVVRVTMSGKPITDDLIDELAAKAEAGYDVEGTTLPDGYLLPEGTTMADVRQLDRELLASEGLEVEGLHARGRPRG